MNLDELNKSKICAQPWFGVQVLANGIGGICCEINDNLPDVNVRENTFAEFQQQPKVIMMRKQMLEGQEPEACWKCYDKERGGGTSLRNVLNKSYIDMNGAFDPEVLTQQNVEFVLGNLCQLRCVMCHPSRSKKVENLFNHVLETNNRKSFIHVQKLDPSFDTDWVEHESTWNKLAEQSQTARRIFINGGEPLLARYHEKVLDKLIENGTAAQTLLVYSTNGLMLDDSHIEKWRQFQHVSVTFSLDDIGERNRFIRYPSPWEQVTAALDKIVEWQKDPRNSNIEFGMWNAINILNFLYLEEYVQFFAEKYPTIKINGWRAVKTPEYLDPRLWSSEIKQIIISRVEWMVTRYPKYRWLLDDLQIIANEEGDVSLLADGLSFMKSAGECYGFNVEELFARAFNK